VNRCDVVIVNFNAGAFLREAVESVLRSEAVAHVYVVDNFSLDASLELLQGMPGDRLTIIHNPANLGFATACNIAIKRAAAENLLLINPDCAVVGPAIDRLSAVLRSSDRIGMVGPLLLNPDGSEQPGGRRRLPTPSRVLRRSFARLLRLSHSQVPDFLMHHDPLPDRPTEVEAISGACMMVRREMIADIGPLDEEYFLHCEDLDWCMRARRHGWTILFVPDAKVLHQKASAVSPGR
jgi:GT2 family glycosyltransferase